MRKIIFIALIALSACNAAQTPQDRYFALTSAVTVVGQATEAYVDTCNEQPASSSCKAILPKINTAAKTMLLTLHQADKVFVTKDSAYYDTSLTIAENAVNDLKNLIVGKQP